VSHSSIKQAAALLVILVLSGCMKMGPDYRRPDIGVEPPEAYQHGGLEAATPVPEDRWWEAFNDADLNDLVGEVLENNLDIRRATAGILEVQARFVQTRADRLPSLGLQAEAKRQRQPVIIPTPGFSSGATLNIYTLSLPASFEIDLWGRLARAEEAAVADLLQATENRLTVSQSIVAETVSLYLQMEALERRIQITEESIESFRRSLALVERRYRRGLSSILDLRQASRILAQAEAVLPGLRQDLGIVQQGLAILQGRYPETRPARPQPDDYFSRLDPVPPGLPSDLLRRRPDVRAAEARMMSLNAAIGVAKASRFPSISLTGNYGYTSTELNSLFESGGNLWNIALGVFQPLFDGGRLKAGQRAAEARYRQGVMDYAQTVLNAFSEVEGALLTRKEQLLRRERVAKFLDEARMTQDVAENRYERGLVNYLTVLDAQQTRFVAEQDLVGVDLAILTNRVAIHRALGGGWAGMEPVDLDYMSYLFF
jgi:multidrug efflux system outer membrane protein